MGTTINCKTLFDITKTNVTTRRPPLDAGNDMLVWQKKRNTQTNFDTIIQVISLRGQPERITEPVTTDMTIEDLEKFGFMYENQDGLKVSSFNFYVNHMGVFDNGFTELGYLFTDCDTVPMIKTDNSHILSDFLDTSPELKNIHFEVIGRD